MPFEGCDDGLTRQMSPLSPLSPLENSNFCPTLCADAELLVRPKLAGMLLTKVDAAAVQTLYADLTEHGLSPGTIDLVHTLLEEAFKLAVRRRKLTFNPMDGVDKPGGKKAA